MADAPLWADHLPPRSVPEPQYALTVSVSAVQAWQRCQQRYAYRYVEGLQPIVSPSANHLGILLHDYLAKYYSGLRDGLSETDAHALGLLLLHERREEYRTTVNFLIALGDEQQAQEFSSILDRAGVLAHRYHEVRGRRDAERYEVLWVEREFRVPLAPGVLSVGYSDMLARDRETGLVGLWEHKTTQNLPPSAHRLRDLQTGIYGAMTNWLDGVAPSEYVWNYVRTKVPTVPAMLQSGHGMTRRKDLDTTWDVYSQALIDNGLDPERYDDVRQRLLHRDTTHWFARFTVPQMIDHGLLIRDYAQQGREILSHRRAWEAGSAEPIRSIDRTCDWCPFLRLCEAALTGGDVEAAINLRFKRSAPVQSIGEWNDRASTADADPD